MRSSRLLEKPNVVMVVGVHPTQEPPWGWLRIPSRLDGWAAWTGRLYCCLHVEPQDQASTGQVSFVAAGASQGAVLAFLISPHSLHRYCREPSLLDQWYPFLLCLIFLANPLLNSCYCLLQFQLFQYRQFSVKFSNFSSVFLDHVHLLLKKTFCNSHLLHILITCESLISYFVSLGLGLFLGLPGYF